MEEKVITDKNNIPWLELRYGRTHTYPETCPICGGELWIEADAEGWWIFPRGMDDNHPVCKRCASFYVPELVHVIDFLSSMGKLEGERLQEIERAKEAEKHVVQIARISGEHESQFICGICKVQHITSEHQQSYSLHKVDGEALLPLCPKCSGELYPKEHAAVQKLRIELGLEPDFETIPF